MKIQKTITLFLLLLTYKLQFAQTQIIIPFDSLHTLIKEHLHSKFHDYSITNVKKAIDKTGIITYKLTASKQRSPSVTIIYDLIYDANSILIRKEKSKSFTYDSSKEPSSKPSNDGHNHQH
jgi:hypothetical protein